MKQEHASCDVLFFLFHDVYEDMFRFLCPYTEEQFEELILSKLPMLRSIAMRILRNACDADDVLQNALVKAWTRRFLLRDSSKMTGWIARIVVNESYGLLRKRKRENSIPLEEASLVTAEGLSVENDEPFQRLEEAIASLPESYKQTVHIAILSGLDTRQAAALLGCSENTLYQRIHKAKSLLRKVMTHE